MPRLLLLLTFAAFGLTASGAPTFSVGLVSDNNTSNSTREQQADTAATATINYSALRIINRDWQGNFGVAASTSLWRKWDGLNLSPVSTKIGLRRKFGLGPYAPRLDLSFEGGKRFAATAERSSNFAISTLSFSQRLTPVLSWHLSADLERQDAERHVFSTTRHMFRIGADYDITPDLRISLNAAEGRGDLVSWCRVSWPEFTGKNPWFDEIFGDDWFPYQSVNRITSAQLSLAYALGDRSTLAATLDLSRSAGTGKRHIYYNEIINVQYIHAF